MKRHDTHLNIRIETKLFERLRKAARKDGLATSQWIRRLFERSLTRRRKQRETKCSE